MRRHEHDDRRAVKQRQHLETVELRHLDVEEEDVGIVLRHRAHGLESVRAFGSDLEVLVGGEILPQDVAGRRLVVNNHGADHAGSSMSTR